jgi:hypothetical protein
VYCSAQAGQNENVIVRFVLNSDIRLYKASSVRVTIDSLFVLSTTPNPMVFYSPELCYRATRAVLKYVSVLPIFIIFPLRKRLS